MSFGRESGLKHDTGEATITDVSTPSTSPPQSKRTSINNCNSVWEISCSSNSQHSCKSGAIGGTNLQGRLSELKSTILDDDSRSYLTSKTALRAHNRPPGSAKDEKLGFMEQRAFKTKREGIKTLRAVETEKSRIGRPAPFHDKVAIRTIEVPPPCMQNLFDFHQYAHELADLIEQVPEDPRLYTHGVCFSRRPNNVRGNWQDFFSHHECKDNWFKLEDAKAWIKALECYVVVGNDYLMAAAAGAIRNDPYKAGDSRAIQIWIRLMIDDAHFARRTMFVMEYLYADYDVCQFSKLGMPKINGESGVGGKVKKEIVEAKNNFLKLKNLVGSIPKPSHIQGVRINNAFHKILMDLVRLFGQIPFAKEVAFYSSCYDAIIFMKEQARADRLAFEHGIGKTSTNPNHVEVASLPERGLFDVTKPSDMTHAAQAQYASHAIYAACCFSASSKSSSVHGPSQEDDGSLGEEKTQRKFSFKEFLKHNVNEREGNKQSHMLRYYLGEAQEEDQASDKHNARLLDPYLENPNTAGISYSRRSTVEYCDQYNIAEPVNGKSNFRRGLYALKYKPSMESLVSDISDKTIKSPIQPTISDMAREDRRRPYWKRNVSYSATFQRLTSALNNLPRRVSEEFESVVDQNIARRKEWPQLKRTKKQNAIQPLIF